MKNYFIRQLQYDRYANGLILNSIKDNGSPEKARAVMAHLLSSQQVWLMRCKEEKAKGEVVLWPDWPVNNFENLIAENSKSWIAFLSQLKDDDRLLRRVSYSSLKGEPFSNTLADILTHLINHGTHHRSQIVQCLKQNGAQSFPITDYIFYIREMETKGLL